MVHRVVPDIIPRFNLLICRLLLPQTPFHSLVDSAIVRPYIKWVLNTQKCVGRIEYTQEFTGASRSRGVESSYSGVEINRTPTKDIKLKFVLEIYVR